MSRRENLTRGGWEPTGTSAERRSELGGSSGERATATRKKLLDAAREAFDEHGYVDTTVDHIVHRAGVARGTFYTYFESKVDIFRHVASAIDEQVAQDVVGFERSGGNDPIANLRISTANYLALVRANADLYRLVEQAAANDESIARARLVSRRRHVTRVAKQIRKWQADGIADSSVDAETTAAVLVAMQSGFAQSMYLNGEKYDEMSAIDIITNLWVASCGLTRRRRTRT
jgi:AcrR family transcriptional regulator